MTDLPNGWTLTEPEDRTYGTYVLRENNAPMAGIRLRVTSVFTGGAVTGRWEWSGLSGAGEMAPWKESGFDEFDDAVAAAVGRLGTGLWTIEQVAAYLGASSTGSARKTLHRLAVKPVARGAGRTGSNLYDPAHVREARDAAPGQGHRTDLKTDD
ncbi:hypothetical protein [Streptomyces sp. NBC_01174]|uniref:hypothetical protein n=1 Tax=Streptomyces sp. NBC_01174 TaxID=2903758 RepID=UPI002F9069F5|nr:hypothetical protein OG414_40885 [Streptomyces sp. NBC_01174]